MITIEQEDGKTNDECKKEDVLTTIDDIIFEGTKLDDETTDLEGTVEENFFEDFWGFASDEILNFDNVGVTIDIDIDGVDFEGKSVSILDREVLCILLEESVTLLNFSTTVEPSTTSWAVVGRNGWTILEGENSSFLLVFDDNDDK